MKILKYSIKSALLAALLMVSACSANRMAEHFNEEALDYDSKPDLVIKSLKIQAGDIIADLGAGGGYYTLRFAEEVGKNGLVYAVDINRDYLEIIKKKAEKAKHTTIQYILADENNSNIPEGSAGLVFIRNVYHELSEPVKYFKNLRNVLKKNGRVAIIEYEKSKFSSLSHIFNHSSDQTLIIKNMQAAGYVLREKFDFLPKQSFSIFMPVQ